MDVIYGTMDTTSFPYDRAATWTTSQPFVLAQRPHLVPEAGPNLATSSFRNSTTHTSFGPPSQSTALAALPTRRKRASKPKVRTGCITCKIRRIKCDEAKPNCQRCTSTGRKCDGYEFPRPQAEDKDSSVALPQNQELTFSKLFMTKPVAGAFQGTAQERRIFHRFQVCTVPAFAGGSESGFWNSLVLKVGQQEPVVRNAIIALGSLHEDYQIRGGKFVDYRTLSDDPSYREVAQRYGKTLRLLNEQLNDQTKATAKVALITSILFACFEILRRNNMAAVVHYQHGMRELIRQMNLPNNKGTSTSPYIQSKSTTQAPFREIPTDELDELMRVFARYDIQACTFSKERAEALSTHITVPTVLPTNLTLSQVRNHLDNLLVSVYQLVKSGSSMYRYRPRAEVPLQWQVRVQEAIQTFEAWMNALEDYFHRVSVPMQPTEVKGLLGLRLQIKVAVIMLKVCIDCAPEKTFDFFLDEFEDMVSEVEKMSSSLQLKDAEPLEIEHIGFTMELGIIHPLFFMAVKCRDWTLRRRAIAQLKKAGKEGVWEGPITAVLAQRIMELEEANLPYGTEIPERNRFHEIKKNVDYEHRRIIMDANRALDDSWQNMHIHRESIPF